MQVVDQFASIAEAKSMIELQAVGRKRTESLLAGAEATQTLAQFGRLIDDDN
jgi:hypothetical protein